MGAKESQAAQFQIPTGQSLLALLMRSREKDVIEYLQKSKNKNLMTEVVSIRGDTLLHYAAGSGSVELTRYLVKKCPNLKSIQNEDGEIPRNLTNEQKILALLN